MILIQSLVKNSYTFFLCNFLLIPFFSIAQSPSILWQHSWGGPEADAATNVKETTDGGYIVVGNSKSNDGDVSGHHGNSSTSDIWVLKLDNANIIQWGNSFGGTRDDYASYVQQTNDEGYIIAGYSESYDGNLLGTTHHNSNYYDYWIIKLNNLGIIQWHRLLGGTAKDIAQAIQQTSDGGYITAGWSESTNGQVTGNHGYEDYWVVKLDSVGLIQWQKSLGGTTGDDAATSIKQTSDGGYIVAGGSGSTDGDVTGHHGLTYNYDYWIVKLDSVGTIQWQKSLGGTKNDFAHSIDQTIDGGYIVAGTSYSDNNDVTGHHYDVNFSLNQDCWIVKLGSSGAIQWQKSLGGTYDDAAYSIQQTNDGGYILAGESQCNDGDVTGNHGLTDYWVVKLNSLGNILWQKTLGGTDSEHNGRAQQTADGGYIIAGMSSSIDGNVTGNQGSSDFWVVKLEGCNLLEPTITLNGAILESDMPTGNQWYYEGTLINGATTQTYIPNLNGYYYVLYTDNFGCQSSSDSIIILSVGISQYESNTNFTVYPNPSNTSFTIETTILASTELRVDLKNTLGQTVFFYTEKANNGLYKKCVDAILEPGIYFLSLQTNEGQRTKKIEIIK